MFEKNSTFRRFSSGSSSTIRVHLGHVPVLETSESDDRRRLVWCVAAAVVVHLILILSQWNWWERPRPAYTAASRAVYVLEPVRFQPPPAQSATERVVQKPKKKRKLIPVPDPTPDEPEPIDDLDVPELDVDEMLVTIPDAPVGRGTGRGRRRGESSGSSGGGDGPMNIGGDIKAPRKVYAPLPIYTEDARQHGVQGSVILHAVIDAQGLVESIQVLRDLPHGLTERAVETVRTWRFEPARRDGRAVAVYYTLTIGFTVQ